MSFLDFLPILCVFRCFSTISPIVRGVTSVADGCSLTTGAAEAEESLVGASSFTGSSKDQIELRETLIYLKVMFSGTKCVVLKYLPPSIRSPTYLYALFLSERLHLAAWPRQLGFLRPAVAFVKRLFWSPVLVQKTL